MLSNHVAQVAQVAFIISSSHQFSIESASSAIHFYLLINLPGINERANFTGQATPFMTRPGNFPSRDLSKAENL